MATTLTGRQTDKARSLIKTEQICIRLQKHIDGEIKLEPSQVRAAEILLNRTLPCLQAAVFSVEGDAALPLLTIVPSNASAAA